MILRNRLHFGAGGGFSFLFIHCNIDFAITVKKVKIIDIKHVKNVQYTIPNGITMPKFGALDDDTLAVIKTFNGPEGNLVLFNELYCYRLASLLGLPMPPSGICLIDNNTDVFADCVEEGQQGYGFFSQYLHKSVVLVSDIIPKISNIEILFKIILFDHVIFNKDRNPGNLLVQYYKENVSLKVIDHSHVFVNQALWDANCLRRCIRENDINSTDVLASNSFLYEMFYLHLTVTDERFDTPKQLFKKEINELVLRSILGDIPETWLPPKEDIEALIEYILYRVSRLDDICKMIIKYINR